MAAAAAATATAAATGLAAKAKAAPRVALAEFRRRRQQLMDLMDDGGIAIVPAAPVRLRNRDTEYPYRQDSDFHYLTGFGEAEAVLVLAPGRAHGEAILFCRDRDREAERWTGTRVGPEAATQVLGVDDAFPIGDMEDILPGLLEGRKTVYFALGADPAFDSKVTGWLGHIRSRAGQGAVAPEGFLELGHLLHDLRLYKSAAELKLMRAAAEITAEGHIRAMHASAPGGTEQGLEAELLYAFMRRGARFPAYECIVGSGANACVLHYTRNDGPLRDGDLVLIDAGCELDHYAADVTRTFPVNGQFTAPQAELYNLVLAAQEAGIAACVPGNHFNRPHEAALEVLVAGLVALGLLKGEVTQIIADESYRPIIAHKFCHWLGLDVHDVGDYRVGDVWRELEPGMVLTVEPGLYLPDDLEGIPAKYRGIGIRIEDDVLVTRQGPEVLTKGAPKTVADIEATMAAADAGSQGA